ncbi:MAG: hypothetical protein K0S37_757 [Microbacterium sp.]|nr:hypothetical protein [Microbacterium sp.]
MNPIIPIAPSAPAATEAPASDTLTVEQLRAMSDPVFYHAVTENLIVTKAYSSPFQDASIIERTEGALVNHLWRVDESLQKQAVDPDCTPERFARAQSFRRHLLATIDIVERRIAWLQGGNKNQLISAWKEFAHDLADALEHSNLASDLDELMVPIGGLTARQWLEVRRIKDPSRVPSRDEVAA